MSAQQDGLASSGEATRTTVVIATRDRCPELLRTLDALGRAAPASDIIVVDNASRDDTVAQVAEHFPATRVLALDRNRGAAARNLGVLLATTPFVAFSDDDSWWDRTALARAETAFDRYPSLGLIAANTIIEPEGREDPVVALMARSPLGTRDELPGPSVLGFTACAAVVRRSAFLQVRGFSSTLFFVGEEKLLAYDLASHGWDLVHLGTVVARHRPSPHRIRQASRDVLEHRNKVLTAWMRRPVRRAASETVRLLRASRRDRIARRAAWSAMRKAPAALSRRRVLPAEVERRVCALEAAHGD